MRRSGPAFVGGRVNLFRLRKQYFQGALAMAPIRWVVLATLALLSQAGAWQPTWAAEYFVSAEGDDTAPGTSRNTAWRSIARVNRHAFAAGDWVRFQGGVAFDGNLRFNAKDKTLADQPIT